MKAKIKSLWVKIRNYLVKEQKIKLWLLQAVIYAEKQLGSGTGKVKLSLVYDMFIERFPVVSKIIPFELFSNFVDDVLVTMRELLKQNTNINMYINK